LLLPSMLDQFLQSKREGVYQLPNGANTGRIGQFGTSAVPLCQSLPTYPICGITRNCCRRRNWLTGNQTPHLPSQSADIFARLLRYCPCGGAPALSTWYLAISASIFWISSSFGDGSVSVLAGSPISS
jgi:hypothetical protein